MMWENDKETGHAKLMTGSLSIWAANALNAKVWRRSPSTTSTAATMTIPVWNGLTGFRCTAAKPKKANCKSYAKHAIASKEGPTCAQTTTGSTTCSPTPSQKNRTNPFNHRTKVSCPPAFKQAPRCKQPSVRRINVAASGAGQRRHETPFKSRAVHAASLVLAAGQDHLPAQSVYGRLHTTPHRLLFDRFWLGGL